MENIKEIMSKHAKVNLDGEKLDECGVMVLVLFYAEKYVDEIIHKSINIYKKLPVDGRDDLAFVLGVMVGRFIEKNHSIHEGGDGRE